MGISIYYRARRQAPLTAEEQETVSEIVSRFAVESQIENYLRSGIGLNWESFCLYQPSERSERDAVVEGATKLPDNSEDASWIGIQHWCGALSEIRRTLPGALWDVAVEDHPIVWDEAAAKYDPAQ